MNHDRKHLYIVPDVTELEPDAPSPDAAVDPAELQETDGLISELSVAADTILDEHPYAVHTAHDGYTTSEVVHWRNSAVVQRQTFPDGIASYTFTRLLRRKRAAELGRELASTVVFTWDTDSPAVEKRQYRKGQDPDLQVFVGGAIMAVTGTLEGRFSNRKSKVKDWILRSTGQEL